MSAKQTPTRRKWTLWDGKTRDASSGPWIAADDVAQFLDFCRRNGHETRDHVDPFRRGYQIRHAGHWMDILWNRSFKRYTSDRRLSLIVQSFAAERAHGITGKEGGAA